MEISYNVKLKIFVCNKCQKEVRQKIKKIEHLDKITNITHLIDRIFWSCEACNDELEVTQEHRKQKHLFAKERWEVTKKQELKKAANETIKTINMTQEERESYFTRPRMKENIPDGMCLRCGQEKLLDMKNPYYCNTCFLDQDKIGKKSRVQASVRGRL